MRKLDISVKGVVPYYYTKPTKDPVLKTEKDAKKVAINRCYSNGKNQLFIPQRQIFGALLNAVFIGKLETKKSTRRTQDLFSSVLLTIKQEDIHFDPPKTKKDIELIEHFTITDKQKMLGQHIWFARLRDWQIAFEATYEDNIWGEDFIKQAFDIAINIAGIGGRRAAGMGKGIIEKFIVH